jgi:hypothetical protein
MGRLTDNCFSQGHASSPVEARTTSVAGSSTDRAGRWRSARRLAITSQKEDGGAFLDNMNH